MGRALTSPHSPSSEGRGRGGVVTLDPGLCSPDDAAQSAALSPQHHVPEGKGGVGGFKFPSRTALSPNRGGTPPHSSRSGGQPRAHSSLSSPRSGAPPAPTRSPHSRPVCSPPHPRHVPPAPSGGRARRD